MKPIAYSTFCLASVLAFACSSTETGTAPSPPTPSSTSTVPTPAVGPTDAAVPDAAVVDAAPEPKPSISGTYKAACRFALEIQGVKLYEANVLVGKDDAYTFDVSLFLDPTCTTKFVTLAEKATYVVRPTSRADGASELDVTRTAMTMTAHHMASLAMLDNGKCGNGPWALGQTQDVYAGGCGVAGFAPASVCTKDFDLIKLSADRLSFGKRPADNDMCTPEKRPTELSPVEFLRQP